MNGTPSAYAPTAEAPWLLVPDDKRGTFGMSLFILTEAMLFVVFFFAYFYVGHDRVSWPPVPPKVTLAVVMLAILVTSSFVLHWAERRQQRGELAAATTGTIITILLGVAFLAVQAVEYSHRLQEISPTTDAYGSLFFTITSFHGAHVFLGLLMLIYALVLPGPAGRSTRPPYRPLHNTSMYWHFVDVVWVFIVTFLYVLPQFKP